MPIYYFNLRGDGHELPDLAGRMLSDEAAARAEAEKLVAELIETARMSGNAPPDEIVEVLDPDLRPLIAIPLREASDHRPLHGTGG
jgi:hypothetical protein